MGGARKLVQRPRPVLISGGSALVVRAQKRAHWITRNGQERVVGHAKILRRWAEGPVCLKGGPGQILVGLARSAHDDRVSGSGDGQHASCARSWLDKITGPIQVLLKEEGVRSMPGYGFTL